MQQRSANSGFSLLEAVVATAILGLCAAGASVALRNSIRSERAVYSARAYRDVDEDLRNAILLYLRTRHLNYANGCTGRAIGLVNAPLGGTGTSISVVSTVPAVLPGALQETTDAANRCNAGARRPGPNADFYFCLTMSGAGTVGNKKGTMLRADQSFAEVNFRFQNLATGAPATCAQFRTSLAAGIGGIGGVLTIGIYWGVLQPSSGGAPDGSSHHSHRIFYVPAR